MVYGTKTWKLSGNEVTNDSTPVPVTLVGRGNSCVFIPGFDIQLGIGYATTLCNKLIGVKLGWEFLQWSNVAQINLLNTTSDKLTLGFQGFTAAGFIVF